MCLDYGMIKPDAVDTQEAVCENPQRLRTGTPTFSLNLWEGTRDNSKEFRNSIGYDVTCSVSITLSTDSEFENGLDAQMDLIDGVVVGMSNGWIDWDEIFYVYSNGSLDDFKTQLDPVGGAAVGISLKAFPGRTTSAGTASMII
ncbi:hypothetical protein EVAR_49266_1 [Eumeta japonica]|uniref:Uncharacterized protein n=1 Tax=Eumeta variegata TaxID=151549 RepID=A0A4C1YJE2_EUMVA|nr:hypothetical protein EVAR_49266_1 [Eumeta japonica]